MIVEIGKLIELNYASESFIMQNFYEYVDKIERTDNQYFKTIKFLFSGGPIASAEVRELSQQHTGGIIILTLSGSKILSIKDIVNYHETEGHFEPASPRVPRDYHKLMFLFGKKRLTYFFNDCKKILILSMIYG